MHGNNPLRRLFLRNDDPENNGGGDDGAMPESDTTSHVEEADKLFGGGNGGSDTPPSGGGGGDGANPNATPKEKTPPAPAKGSVFGALHPKKPDAGAPAAGAAQPLPEDAIVLGGEAKGKTAEHFANLKNILKTVRGELTAREAKIAEYEKRGPGAPPADYERLKTEHKTYSDRLAVLDLQNHPDFIRQYVEPKKALVGQLDGLIKANGLEGVDVASLIGLPRAELSKRATEIAGKLTEFDADEFKAGIRQALQLEAKSGAALADASKLAGSLRSKTLEEQRTNFGKAWDAVGGFGEWLPKLEHADGMSDEEKAAVDAYNKGIEELRPAAEKMAFGQATDESVASTAIKAASFDFYLKHAIPRMELEFRNAAEIIARQNEEIKALRGAKGAEDIAGGGGGGGGGDGGLEEMDHEAGAKKVFRR